ARLEVAPDELPRLDDAALRAAVTAAVVAAGYAHVLVDPQGYRRGRLNEALSLKVVTVPLLCVIIHALNSDRTVPPDRWAVLPGRESCLASASLKCSSFWSSSC